MLHKAEHTHVNSFCNHMRCVCDIILLDIFAVQKESDLSVAS